MATINEKIKILVLGDSGVGKSSLVHLICHSETLARTRWTIGCAIDVKLYRYKEGSPQEKTCFIEFWDVGGSRSHSIARKIFFNSFHGIILVQDLTNRKSESNLKNWLGQALVGTYNNNNDKERFYSNSLSQALFPVSDNDDFEHDSESFVGLNIPILIVATKQDLVAANVSTKTNLVDLLHCDSIQLNCRNPKSLSPGTTNAVKLSRFLDHVCDKRLQSCSSINLSNDKNVYHRQSSSSSSSYYYYPNNPNNNNKMH
ncbi:ras-like protein [Dermatophagoides farinae]|uniref:Ras-like protein n=1 Tax=Dermatophagoides farinae TaxID=6954 RepID=A0A9D4NZV7_DERFA|nr:rab-like protein 3 [Dermatophagoides farinae]KAH7641104.1 ras-like protein [Dermatophagoides farinae]